MALNEVNGSNDVPLTTLHWYHLHRKICESIQLHAFHLLKWNIDVFRLRWNFTSIGFYKCHRKKAVRNDRDWTLYTVTEIFIAQWKPIFSYGLQFRKMKYHIKATSLQTEFTNAMPHGNSVGRCNCMPHIDFCNSYRQKIIEYSQCHRIPISMAQFSKYNASCATLSNELKPSALIEGKLFQSIFFIYHFSFNLFWNTTKKIENWYCIASE